MYTTQPKKLLIINILDILKKYTDVNHRLTQKDIMEILDKEYQMTVDRKSIKRNLMNLMEFGYALGYNEKVRTNKNGEEEIISTDWYLERKFTDAELRLLVDGLLFSKHIPYSQCKELIEKIESLSNKYFRLKVDHICNLPENMPENKQMFYNIEILDEAITQKKQVEFNYNDFSTEKKLELRLGDDGKPRHYVINPYQMVATNGRYYLICNNDKYDDVVNYRVERITDIKLLNTPRKAFKKVQGLEHGINLPKFMAEHIYMYRGESAQVSFRADLSLVTEIIDWFGKDIVFSDKTDKELTATVTVNLMAMRYWILQHAPYVRVLEPQSLVDTVKTDLKAALSKYGD